jgi:hypothetical protein
MKASILGIPHTTHRRPSHLNTNYLLLIAGIFVAGAWAHADTASDSKLMVLNKPSVSMECSLAKTARGPIGEDAGSPELSLIFVDEALIGSAFPNFFFYEKPEGSASTERTAYLTVEGKQVYLQSSEDSSRKIFIGTSRYDLRDLQSILPACRIRSNNQASEKMVGFIASVPLKAELKEIKPSCNVRTWKVDSDGSTFTLSDGLPPNLHAGDKFETYLPIISRTAEISSGQQTFPVDQTDHPLFDDLRYGLETREIGFGHRESCEKYLREHGFPNFGKYPQNSQAAANDDDIPFGVRQQMVSQAR